MTPFVAIAVCERPLIHTEAVVAGNISAKACVFLRHVSHKLAQENIFFWHVSCSFSRRLPIFQLHSPITAIPEPSTYAAAVGLIGLMLWPSRRRLIKDAKSIFGLRVPMRDRLAKRA